MTGLKVTDRVVVIGGGHAAAQVCAGLVDAGAGAQVHLVCDEPLLPYHRPPLSKAFLKSAGEAVQPLRTAAWYAEKGITVHLQDAALAVDLAQHAVTLQSGTVLRYTHLVLATGTRARRLPTLPDHLVNVAVLRTAADAQALRAQIAAAAHVTVLGGGFIGLEVAATARALGKAVTVLEAAPRLLARSVSPELAEHVLRTHRAAGIDVVLGAAVGHFDTGATHLHALHVDGQRHAVDLLVLGIGAEPDCRLAQAAGLACAHGIKVDAHMRSSHPQVLAVGDCATFAHPASGRPLRLESVQNANDQARTAVATLLGRLEPYCAVPWFWSEQGGLRLQMAGLMPAEATRLRRAGAGAAGFSILHYVGDTLACVESVNSPLDHMAARKLLELQISPAPALACDAAVPLKAHLPQVPAPGPVRAPGA